MIKEFRKYYYTSIFNLFKEQLINIANEFNLDYKELEELYLSEFKEYLNLN